MKKNYCPYISRISYLLTVLYLIVSIPLNAQVDFSSNTLDFNGIGSVKNGTSLMFGPDGRLYVAEYRGGIKIFTIQRNGPGDYVVTDQENLTVTDIQNHNDDGSQDSGTKRETLGLTVAGTAQNPVIYVTSSDFRIGGGSGGGDGDENLDTNSGVITRFTWNGSSWDVIDLVRGLPRSEENHATNGLEFVNVNGTNYLIVASGGHTNGGAPSTNFAYLTEYALSAAIISVNLDMINAMTTKFDDGRPYKYDMPTLDDPTRNNVNGITDPDAQGYDGIDINDPFGGNDGLNQAKIDPTGPVQIFSPGYRNAYDLVITASGAVYVTDNGPNQNWGGLANNEGTPQVNNNYVLDGSGDESGGSLGTAAPDGEYMNNKDHLHVVTLDISNYTFGSFYGGHPTPIRANPAGAGLFTAPEPSGTNNAVFRTLTYDPNESRSESTSDASIALPADWPPVPIAQANPVEGDWRGSGLPNPEGPIDDLVTIWPNNTNGIDEYTSSQFFGGAMQGDLIAGNSDGILFRVQVNPDGTLSNLSELASGLPGVTNLGVTCNSDTEIFPGTIWVAPFNNIILVLEPQGTTNCVDPSDQDYDPTADYDGDGYTNQDEEDNGTDACNGGSRPNDFDASAGGTLVSDLNDTDDDNDGIPDANDPFQIGDPTTGGSDAFTLPVDNELLNGNPDLKGFAGLGLTGLMNNGDPNPNWLLWLDRVDDPNDPNPNDILGGATGLMTMQMTSGTAFGNTNTQEKAFQYGIQTDQNTGMFTVRGAMSNFNTPSQLYGNTGTPNGELGLFIGDGTQSNYIKFVITKEGLVAQQEIGDNPQTALTQTIATQDRPGVAVTFYFVIDPSNGEVTLQYEFDASGTRLTLGTITAQGNILTTIQQSGTDLAVGMIGTSNTTGQELEGTWEFLDVTLEGLPNPGSPTVLYRVNAGGPQINAIDGGINWGADEVSNNSPYLTNPGSNLSSAVNISNHTYDSSIDNNSVPNGIFSQERFDGAQAPNMQYSFPVTQSGNYEIRLYMANGFSGTANPEERIFSVEIEGTALPLLTNIDLSATYGHQVATMISHVINITDGDITVEFLHGAAQNPIINGIEILKAPDTNTPIYAFSLPNQTSAVGEELDGSLGIIASGGDGNLTFLASGLPPGISMEPTNGQIGGTVSASANLNTPYNVQVIINDTDGDSNDTETVGFQWSVLSDEWIDKDENENYTGRHECSFVQAGNRFYLMGGRENSRTIDVYNYANNSWTSLVDSAPFALNHSQATEYGGLIWIIGAFTSNNFPNEPPAEAVWMFDPATEEWIEGASIPAARRRGSSGVVVYNDKFYVVGGNTIGHNGGYVSWFDEFDPATGQWTALTDAPRARDHFHAVVIGNKLYAAGGRLSGGAAGTFKPTISDVDVYDFDTGTWSTLSNDLPTPRGAPAAVNFNNKLWVIGGEVQDEVVYGVSTTDALPITEQYDPATGQWTRMADLNSERHGTQAIVSGGGVFILAGSPKIGGGPSGNQKNMEYYGQDTPTGNPSTSSSLSVPANVQVAEGSSTTIAMAVNGGTVGVVVKSMEISGTDAPDFNITQGDLNDAFIPPGTTHEFTVALSGTGENRSANLTINYGNSSSEQIALSSTTSSGEGVVSFTLINADTENDLFSLVDGQQIDLASVNGISLNVRANTQPALVGSVYFELSGPLSNTRNENGAPYALFGDSGGGSNYFGREFTEGIYTLTATAYNGRGRSGGILGQPLTIQFSIEDLPGGGNLPPNAVVTADPESGVVPLLVNFTGNGSTDDVNIVSYTWDFNDGNTSTAIDPSNTFTTAGSYEVELTVTDGEGLTDTSSITITVNDPVGNTPPQAIATANVQTGVAPLTVDFTGSNSTDDLGVETYFWDFKDGTTSTDPDPSHTFNSAGTYIVELTVTDIENASDSTTINITVTDTATTGVVSFTMVDSVSDEDLFEITEGQVVDWSLIESLGVNIRANTIPETIGSVFFELTGTVSNTRTESSAPYALYGDGGGNYRSGEFVEGNYTLTATGFNGPGRTGGVLGVPLVIQFSIQDLSGGGNSPPLAVATADPQSGTVPLLVNFTGNASMDDQGIISYFWDFKDGNTSTEQDPSNTFTVAGNYEVALTVTDAENLTDTATVLVSVGDDTGNLPPVVQNPGTQNSTEGDAISLQIQASDDTTLMYEAEGLPPGLSINPNTGEITGVLPVSQSGDGAFLESNGLVIIEAESGELEEDWSLVSFDNEIGILGGRNYFTQQNGGTIPYQITISEAGIYRINWHSAYTGDRPSERNDSWLRFPNNNDVWFFGQQMAGNENSIINNLQGAQEKVVFPKGSSRITSATTPGGGGSNGYFKVFRSSCCSEEYKWQAVTSDGNGHRIYVWFVNPGTYTMEISERSEGHAIDRVALYRVTGPSYSDAQLSAFPESQRSGSGSVGGASENSPYTVTITVTDDGVPQESEQIQFVWNVSLSGSGNQPPIADADASPQTGDVPLLVNFSGSDSGDDVGIVSYFWDFKDGNTSTLENPTNTFTTPGFYTVELTVTDTDGATDTDTVNVTVVDPTATGPVGFTMVDAVNDIDLFEITDGQVIDFASIDGLGANIRANTSPSVVGSVLIELTGALSRTRTENGAPYALWGDGGGNYRLGDLVVGSYTLTATAFNGAARSGGMIGQPLTVQFTITGQAAQAPPAPNLGVEETTAFNTLSDVPMSVLLFPNPASSTISISITNSPEPLGEIQMYDISGRLVKRMSGDQVSGSNTVAIPVTGLEEGLYFVRLRSKTNLWNKDYSVLIKK
ncbi:MAG: PKD domain-containing protein [Bacteroidota bacterium]